MNLKPNVSRKILIPLILVCAFFSWLFVYSMKPVPSNLITASGTIGSISAYERRGHLSEIYLYVTEIDKTFEYDDDFLPNIEGLEKTARRNMPIKVMYSETGFWELGNNIWGLELNGEKFINPDETRSYRQKKGYQYLAIAAGLLLLSIYLTFFKGKEAQA
jgi:hypothetical protein